MAYQNTGEIQLEEADDLNVPVCSFVLEPDSESPKWRWTAHNYMPRKDRIDLECTYAIEADTKEEILEAVRRHVVPLYEAALHNLTTHGQNYFFSKKS